MGPKRVILTTRRKSSLWKKKQELLENKKAGNYFVTLHAITGTVEIEFFGDPSISLFE